MTNSPLPGVLRPVATPAAWVYGRVIARRNARFDAGHDTHDVGCPVISVGNLTTGGVGKSPVVRTLCTWLLDAGKTPAIAMRGYGARPGQPSDEASEYADLLPTVPVLANPDRVGTLREFLPAHPEVDVVVLDDGFQHRRLRRTMDLVLIDATRHTFDDRLLPAGHLREPFDALARADAVIVTRATSVDATLDAAITRYHGRPAPAWTRHAWTGLDLHDATGTRTEPVDWLNGRSVVTSLGVGHPESIAAQITASGATIVDGLVARDHQTYDAARVHALAGRSADADAVIVTRKDWVKIRPVVAWTDWAAPIAVPRLEIEFLAGEDDLRRLVLDVPPPA